MTVLAPSRPLDEFEQLVYEYTLRMGLGENQDEKVVHLQNPEQHPYQEQPKLMMK